MAGSPNVVLHLGAKESHQSIYIYMLNDGGISWVAVPCTTYLVKTSDARPLRVCHRRYYSVKMPLYNGFNLGPSECVMQRGVADLKTHLNRRSS